MSMYFRENGEIYEPEYERPGRTKQSFKDSCDINKILAKAQKAGSLSHLQKHGAYYGDFADAPQDLFEAREMLARGESIFREAPAEIRAEFGHDPLKFFAFANKPENRDRLDELLPKIAEPGKYFPDVRGNTPPDALVGAGAQPGNVTGAGGPPVVDTPNTGDPVPPPAAVVE